MLQPKLFEVGETVRFSTMGDDGLKRLGRGPGVVRRRSVQRARRLAQLGERNGKQGREQEAGRLQIEAPQQHRAPIARANGACAECLAQRRLLRNCSAIR